MNTFIEWTIYLDGKSGDPSQDRICITCLGSQRIVLEVECPGIRSAGDRQIDQARKAIRKALEALDDAVDSPTALPGLQPASSTFNVGAAQDAGTEEQLTLTLRCPDRGELDVAGRQPAA